MFVNRFKVFNVMVPGSVVSIMAGGFVTGFLKKGNAEAWEGYCCGLDATISFYRWTGALGPPERLDPQSDPRLRILDELKKDIWNPK